MRYANLLPTQIESQVVALKRKKPHSALENPASPLVRRLYGDTLVLNKHTSHAVLHWDALVKRLRHAPLKQVSQRAPSAERERFANGDKPIEGCLKPFSYGSDLSRVNERCLL